IIPVRDYDESANSRAKNGSMKDNGGLWNANDTKEQVQFYHKIMAEYILKMVKFDIPTLFVDFGRMTVDAQYLYKKLHPILAEHDISQEKFFLAYKKASENQRKTKLPDDFGQHSSTADQQTDPTPDDLDDDEIGDNS